MEADIMPRETDVRIVVYSKNPCVQCTAVKRHLTKEGADYEVIDVGLPENAGDLEALKALDFMNVPVTFVNDEPFYGYQPDKLDDAIARQRRTEIHAVPDEATAA